jgi:Uma2 family endonuclease
VPNVSVFVWERIPLDQNGDVMNSFAIAPDWTIEILSPEQSQTKVTDKILHCLNHGCQMGWLVDPDERSVLIYPAGQQPQLLSDLAAPLLVPTFANQWQITVGDLFAWLHLSKS